MPELEINDKHGVPLNEGDVVVGHLGWVGGYKRKSFPDTVRALLSIRWNPWEAQYDLRHLGIIFEDHKYFARCNNYREIMYELSVDPVRVFGDWGCGIGGTRRTDMRALSLEKINVDNYIYYHDYLAKPLYNAQKQDIIRGSIILKQVNDTTCEVIDWFNNMVEEIEHKQSEKLLRSIRERHGGAGTVGAPS